MDACYLFPQCVLTFIPLIKGCTLCCDQSLHWKLSVATSLLCGCHSPVMGRVCSLVVGAKVKVTRSCPTLCDHLDFTVHGILQARILEWVSLSFLQGIFPTQGSNPGLPHCSQILYHLSHRKPRNTGVGTLSLLQQIFPTQELTGVSCVAGGFFTN